MILQLIAYLSFGYLGGVIIGGIIGFSIRYPLAAIGLGFLVFMVVDYMLNSG